ncbi:Whirlin [Liparis tanakae]|uniref:Whirlin n=1 Tax=Liparis tanakae TaxID=230148 RepID=A0A4Z2EHE4_9TELE|nr:Whirlin [Liparis tanakae]
MEVNGQSFLTISHDEAVEILKTGRHLLVKVRHVGRLPHARTVLDETRWPCSQDPDTAGTAPPRSGTGPPRSGTGPPRSGTAPLRAPSARGSPALGQVRRRTSPSPTEKLKASYSSP